MNHFHNLAGRWVIACDAVQDPGNVVTIAKRDGTTSEVKLGAPLGRATFQATVRYLYENVPLGRPAVAVGDLKGILALFDRAATHLKFPAVVLGVPDLPYGIRVTRAGPRAKAPGTLNINAGIRDGEGFGRTWYGRVDLAGTYEPARETPHKIATAIAGRLREFAADPVKVAGDHGRLTGRCCFCALPLTDERSTAVGYGATCAAHFGLPWGAKPKQFAEAV